MNDVAQPWPTQLKLHKDRRTLTIAFDNGESFDLGAEYLRVRSPSAGIAISVWVAISSRRFGTRSASRPPQAPIRSIGRNCSAVVRPTARPLPVRLRTSQIAATVCIQVPESEISWPLK